jgi:hypothetical protein
MSGNIFVVLLISFSLIFGLTLWYFQNYAYYEKNSLNNMTMTLSNSGSEEPVKFNNIQSINSQTSPLKFRSCFKLKSSSSNSLDKYLPYEKATPLRAPRWFKCFNVEKITSDLKLGLAKSYLSKENIEFGIDRVIAVYPNGLAFSWHQINDCGLASFAGDALPKNCTKKESE